MQRRSRHFVRAFLLLPPLRVCHPCGRGSHDEAHVTATTSSDSNGPEGPPATLATKSI
jgi:hypothetical protein